MWICLLGFWLSDGLSARQMQRAIQRELAAAVLADGVWGISVYAPQRARYLFERNPEVNFRPASNMKILTTFAAFTELGPDFQFVTEFAHTGSLNNGLLEGDLVITGGGDPSISGNYVEGLETRDLIDGQIDCLMALGVGEVLGNIVVRDGLFDQESVDGTWEIGDLGTYYGASVSALALHDGWSTLSLSVDEQGHVESAFDPPWIRVPVTLNVTVNARESSHLELNRWGDGSFTVIGNVRPCDEQVLRMAALDTSLHFGRAFALRARERGLLVHGDVIRDNRSLIVRPLFNQRSESLAVLAQTLMKRSQNRYADCFAKSIAASCTGSGSFDGFSARLMDLLEQRGIETMGLSVRDGSGLSAQNYIRPRTLVEVLSLAWTSDFAQEWLKSFPVMGVDGTLERRGNGVTAGGVWAKTGYIYRARCLSGYVETNAGEPLVFSMMVNNYGCPTTQINEIQDRICSLLRQLKPRRFKNDQDATYEFTEAFDR